MKSKLLTAVFLMALVCVSTKLEAQKKIKDYLITGSAMFVSGMLDGTIESINWHYQQGFKTRCPKANDQFWDPNKSWTNKYKNGNSLEGPKFKGSTTVFAFTTDAYHLLRTGNRAVNTFALVYYVNKECRRSLSKTARRKLMVKDFFILTAIRSAGFTLTYGLVFKKQPEKVNR